MKRLVGVFLLATMIPGCTESFGPIAFGPCGGDPDPCSSTPPPCNSRVISDRLFFSWNIRGFTLDQLTDPNARTDLVVQLRVGQTQELMVVGSNTWGVDCTGEVAAVRWGLGTTDIVTLSSNDTLDTVLTAVAPGDTTLFADLDFKNGRHARAEPWLFTNTSSGHPIVRVVPEDLASINIHETEGP